MDECLNDDDDAEEHHRVLSDCFDAQHKRPSFRAGSENAGVNKPRTVLLFAMAPVRPARTVRIPLRTGPRGRLMAR
jgi:hypothetical protein